MSVDGYDFPPGMLKSLLTGVLAGLGVTLGVVRWFACRYVSQVDEALSKLEIIERNYVGRTEYEQHLEKLEHRLEARMTEGFKTMTERLDKLYHALTRLP